MASTYLSRTPASASNRKTWTFSAWVKRGNISNNDQHILYVNDSSNDRSQIKFEQFDALHVQNKISGTTKKLITNRVFRDVSSWYHIVIEVDTTQATESDRVKLYINGTQETSFSTEEYPSQNDDWFVNNNDEHNIGRRIDTNSLFFDGSMAHVHLTDGTAYDADTFGETDATTGIWKPKTAPSVTYGTNGFFLKFENSGAFGTDSSGNGNNFTVNGTMTQTIDTPSNVFATLNSLNYSLGATFSNGNLTVTNTSSGHRLVMGSLAASSGKYYAECKATTLGGSYPQIGILDMTQFDRKSQPGAKSNGYAYLSDGRVFNNNGAIDTGEATYTSGDIIGVAVDLDNNYVYFHKNGTYINSGDPTSGASGTGGYSITANLDYTFSSSSFDSGTDPVQSWNFGNGFFGTTAVSSAQNPDDGIGIFEYDVPAGYRALCTKSINAEEYS